MMVLIKESLRYFSRETRTIEETRVPRDSCLAFFAHALYGRANTTPESSARVQTLVTVIVIVI